MSAQKQVQVNTPTNWQKPAKYAGLLLLLLLGVWGIYKILPDNAVQNMQIDRETITANGISFDMIFVQGGTFTMGCTNEQGTDCYDSEKPAHQVILASYKISETEVTKQLWVAVMGNNESYFKENCAQCPIEEGSWEQVKDFITKLNTLTGKNFRLPTEAEWEYAARGGAKTKGYKYAGSDNIDEVAWYITNSDSKTHAVKGKKPNELGLYDMNGNVWEWCEDDWHGDYNNAPNDGKTWIDSPRGSSRILRGGARGGAPRICRVSNRNDYIPGSRLYGLGFRLALGS